MSVIITSQEAGAMANQVGTKIDQIVKRLEPGTDLHKAGSDRFTELKTLKDTYLKEEAPDLGYKIKGVATTFGESQEFLQKVVKDKGADSAVGSIAQSGLDDLKNNDTIKRLKKRDALATKRDSVLPTDPAMLGSAAVVGGVLALGVSESISKFVGHDITMGLNEIPIGIGAMAGAIVHEAVLPNFKGLAAAEAHETNKISGPLPGGTKLTSAKSR